MQSVGDQVTQLVANLEHDYIVARQHIDELVADNDGLHATADALTSANAVLEKQLADRTSALADTEKRMDEALAQVEVVANAALNMLKTVRGQRASLEAVQGSTAKLATQRRVVDESGAVIKDNAAPTKLFTAEDRKTFVRGGLAGLADIVNTPAPEGAELSPAFLVPKPVDATQQDTAAIVDDVAIDPSFGERVAADIMTADNAIESDDALLIGDSEDGHEMVDLSPIKQALEEKLTAEQIKENNDKALAAPDYIPLAPAIAPPVELDAVDRMRRTSDLLPAPTLSRNDGPVLVVRNEPLPIFLARDTVFGRNDPRL